MSARYAGIPGCPAAWRGGSRRFMRHSHLDQAAAQGGAMVRRDDSKTQALAASRTLNPRPEKVTDPAFGPGGFFDPADLVQVKYEMVRRAEMADVPASRAAADFGFSRQSLYSARAALRERGLAGADPGQAWPQGRPQAHRPGRGPAGGPAGGRPRPAAGGSGRRGPGPFRRQRPSAFGRAGAAAPPHRPARGRAERRAGPRGGAQKP